MAPKKKGAKKKGKSGGKPEWMSQELYDLSQNLAKLQEFWCGEVKESKGKGKDGQPLPDPPNISKEQVWMDTEITFKHGCMHSCMGACMPASISQT